ncbi:MAG: hypothetical protein NC131_00900 [Roseburia sp.]|nr:hypothetical protein [Roseburia sp.]
MDKKKDIKAMTKICEEHREDWGVDGFCGEQAKALSEAGYGNVKQAVKEFGDELKEIFDTKHTAVMANVVHNRVDNLFKELYGED